MKKRHSLSILMALTISGMAAGIAVPAASALTVPTTTTVNQVVGHSTDVKLGKNKPYSVSTCTSASAATVTCQVLSGPAQKVQIWCLESTLSAVHVTVTYVPVGAAQPLPPTTLLVNCAAAPIKTFKVLNSSTRSPLQSISSVSGCSTNVFGTFCSYQGKVVTLACTLAVTGNALPILVDATVTVTGVPAVNNKTTDIFFKCAA